MKKILAATGLLLLAALLLLVVDVIGIAHSAEGVAGTRARAIHDVRAELGIE